MTQNLELAYVTRPSDEELQAAIHCFSEDANNEDGDFVNATLAIVGEACTLLAEGKSEEETIASLGERGLSADCATPFVEKAREIVQSNRNLESVATPADQGNAPKLLLAAIVIVFALAYVFIGVA